MSTATVQTGTIETRIPSRLDRLPWARFHWMIIVGLGTAWILDGLEVTMVGAVASRMTESGSGIALTAADVGLAGAIYVLGACLGALFFGQLCDRFGRKKLFMITLGIYIVATVATAFSLTPWFFFAARFVTGAGIGGEYSAINSAIDELIPARVRGRVDLVINGSYWLGSAAGSAAALFFLSTVFPKDLGWRVSFGVGAVIGLAVLFVRRSVPESPRWLFIHGRQEEAERIVDGIEAEIEDETGQELSRPDKSITVRQRTTVRFREIGRVAFKTYPRRSILCLALFVGQAFLYNGITFDLGTLMTTFFGVSAAFVPIYLIVYAGGNFTGPVLLGRLFDTIGRKPMVSGTYLGSAVLSIVLAGLFAGGSLTAVTFIIVVVAVFFLASAGASAAYLTASEIFPMETRALAIAFFYAVGTAVGGVVGPLLFGKLIATGQRGPVAIAFLVGAGVMAVGGIAELLFGVKAEGAQLEDVAKPLTVEDAEQGEHGEADAVAGASGGASAASAGDGGDGAGDRAAGNRERARAADERACAAEHRAVSHELLARAAEGDEAARERAETEQVLAQVADATALAHDEKAAAEDELAAAEAEPDSHQALAARERAQAAQERARAHEQEAQALAAADDAGAEQHRALADAALERARSRKQKARAEQLRAGAESVEPDEADRARADAHDLWAAVHSERARAHEAHADGDRAQELASMRSANALTERAYAAKDRVEAAEHRSQAAETRAADRGADAKARDEQAGEDAERRTAQAAQAEADRRARERIERRWARERTGTRRYRLGPGSTSGSPGMGVSMPLPAQNLDREIGAFRTALDEHGATERAELARLVGARYWGPGVFRAALRDAVADGDVRRTSRSTYAPADTPPPGPPGPSGSAGRTDTG